MHFTKYKKPVQPTVDSFALTDVILDDIFRDFNNSRWWIRVLVEPIARPATYRFAQIMAYLDYVTAHYGFRESMCEAVKIFTDTTKRIGYDHVPEKGPLLVVSNHPGTFDSMIIASSLPRDDLKIIATGFPLLRNLPNANQHMILIDPKKGGLGSNISVIRDTIRHLDSGGAVLIFPSGKIEPDPSVLPGAIESLQSWSPSIELFLRKVPRVKVQFTAVSGVLAPRFMRHPLINFLSGSRNPQATAETIQTVTQMLFEHRVQLRPTVSFGIPKTLSELQQKNKILFQAMIAEASQLLHGHMQGNMIQSS